MDDRDYEEEVAVLKKNSKELAAYVVSQRPSIVQVKKCHWGVLAEQFWSCGVAKAMVWVDNIVVPAYSFTVDDLFEAHPLAVITNGEADAIVACVVKSLDVSASNVLKALTDIVQPDADVVMARNMPIDIELQMENDVSARTCQFCGSMFLRGERNDGTICCKQGLMLQFALNPLPEEMNTVIDVRNSGPARIAKLCRPLNSYFAFSRLRTSGFFASGINSVDLNVGQDQAMMRICGRAYNVVMQNISTTMNAYVFDGTSDHLIAQ
jgi:hypothetical protein